MEFGVLFPVLFLVPCALMMIFMMRGHGGHGGEHEHHDVSAASVDELRRRRDELDRELAAREGSSLAVSSCTDAERDEHEATHRPAPARR
jgi:hypothetical protein